jgi:hypothetical protein
MVRVPVSRMADRGFQLRSDKTKYYNIGICSFFAKHATLRHKSKDKGGSELVSCVRVARHVYPWIGQYHVSEWSDMSTHGLVSIMCPSGATCLPMDWSVSCVRVERHVYPWIGVSLN